jgi:hypothetical protein
VSGAGGYPQPPVSPFWFWMQVLIVLFVVAGMIIALTKI